MASGRVDPRTQLPIVEIPTRYRGLSDLRGSIVHWVGTVRKLNSSLKEEEKVLLLGDSALYVCDASTGIIRRCSTYAGLRELILREGDNVIGFVHQNVNDVDILLRFPTASDSDKLRPPHTTVVDIIRKIYWVHLGRELLVKTIPKSELVSSHLKLVKPADWSVRIEPLKTVKYLDRMVVDQTVVSRRHEERVSEEFTRIKRELLQELEFQRNEQYGRMVRQCITYVTKLDALEEDSRLLRGRIAQMEPQCSGLGAAPTPTTRTGAPEGQARKEECSRCAELKTLLEQDPATGKRRAMVAEESVELLKKQLAEPLQKEVKSMRDGLQNIEGILRDQSVPSAERVRLALESSGPLIWSNTIGGPAPPQPAPVLQQSQTELQHEIHTLRILLREAHAFHSAELLKLQRSIRDYDRDLVKAVKGAIEKMPAAYASGTTLTRQAEDLVALAREERREEEIRTAMETSPTRTAPIPTAFHGAHATVTVDDSRAPPPPRRAEWTEAGGEGGQPLGRMQQGITGGTEEDSVGWRENEGSGNADRSGSSHVRSPPHSTSQYVDPAEAEGSPGPGPPVRKGSGFGASFGRSKQQSSVGGSFASSSGIRPSSPPFAPGGGRQSQPHQQQSYQYSSSAGGGASPLGSPSSASFRSETRSPRMGFGPSATQQRGSYQQH